MLANLEKSVVTGLGAIPAISHQRIARLVILGTTDRDSTAHKWDAFRRSLYDCRTLGGGSFSG